MDGYNLDFVLDMLMLGLGVWVERDIILVVVVVIYIYVGVGRAEGGCLSDDVFFVLYL
jgi:hypothetical protein